MGVVGKGRSLFLLDTEDGNTPGNGIVAFGFRVGTFGGPIMPLCAFSSSET